jgi:hypothetical protein
MDNYPIWCMNSAHASRFLGLEAFLAVAERGSFHRAAAHLSITQTALSHRIRKFEEELREKLFIRTTRSVALTPAGLALLPRARQFLGEARELLVVIPRREADEVAGKAKARIAHEEEKRRRLANWASTCILCASRSLAPGWSMSTRSRNWTSSHGNARADFRYRPSRPCRDVHG